NGIIARTKLEYFPTEYSNRPNLGVKSSLREALVTACSAYCFVSSLVNRGFKPVRYSAASTVPSLFATATNLMESSSARILLHRDSLIVIINNRCYFSFL